MIFTKIKDVDLKFETESSLFSPNFIDSGTLAMLSVIDFLPSDKVLDLGCGYGVVGILAGKLIGEENDFTLILTNPPYHADFSVPKNFIESSFKKLAMGGRLVMVTKRLDWYKYKLISVFGGVNIQEIEGYYVFVAEKRSLIIKKKSKPAKNLSKKLQRKQKKRLKGN